MTKLASRYLPGAIALCVAALLGAGCTADGSRYPSLAQQDVERMTANPVPAQQAAPPQAFAVPGDRINRPLHRAQALNMRFAAERPMAIALFDAAKGTASDSNERSEALVALGVLTALRTQTISELGSLDELESEAAVVFGSLDEIRAAQDQITGLIREQDAVIALLEREIPGPAQEEPQ